MRINFATTQNAEFWGVFAKGKWLKMRVFDTRLKSLKINRAKEVSHKTT